MNEIRNYKGQDYKLVETLPYVRVSDGTETELAIWESSCAKCGEPFRFARPTEASEFHPNRRCRKHRRPGIAP